MVQEGVKNWGEPVEKVAAEKKEMGKEREEDYGRLGMKKF